MIDHFTRFAAYNRWANQRLYDAAAQLSADEYVKDCGVAFNSMHGTLNHILLGDKVWMGRFQQQEFSVDRLDAVLHEDFASLSAARAQMDQQIIDYIATLDQKTLDGVFTYTPVTIPKPVTLKLSVSLAHLFNHQTHHRGQAHAILTRLKGEAPPLDLIYFHLQQAQ